MSLEYEIIATLRTACTQQPLRLDPRQGQTWHLSLQKALGGHVEDASDYAGGRSYRFTRSISSQEESRFRSTLVVHISMAGSFATYNFVQSFKDEHWWSQAIRYSRSGFTPDDAAFLLKLRTWLSSSGLREVESRLLALPVPDDIPVPRRRGAESQPTLFSALFGH